MYLLMIIYLLSLFLFYYTIVEWRQFFFNSLTNINTKWHYKHCKLFAYEWMDLLLKVNWTKQCIVSDSKPLLWILSIELDFKYFFFLHSIKTCFK